MKQVLLFIAILSCVFSQTGNSYAEAGFGARAMGMGNAFTGVADDATAIAWNPAGLTNLYSPEFSITGRFKTGSYELDLDEDPNEFFDGLTQERKSDFGLNFFSYVHPVKFEFATLVFGGAYRSLYNWNDEITQTTKYSDEIGGKQSYNNIDKTEGGINAFTLSTGVKLLNFAAIGISFNNISGTLDQTLSQNNEGTLENSELDSFKESRDYSGSFVDLGLLLKFGDSFQIGYKTSSAYDRTSEVHQERYVTQDLIDSENDFKTVLEVPNLQTIGLGIRFSDYSTLSVDFKVHKWSKAETYDLVEVFGEEEEQNRTEYTEFDLNSFHIGYETLDVNENTGTSTAWRFGYFTKPYLEYNFTYDTSGDLVEGDQIINNVLTMGWGYSSDFLAFDVSAQWEIHSSENGVRFGTFTTDADFTGNTIALNTTLIFYL